MPSAAISAILAGLTFGAAGPDAPAPDLLQQLPPVATAPAATQPAAPISTILTLQGQVEPKSRVSIVAKAYLPVVDLPCREGDRVTKGDGTTSPTILARLDDADLQASLRTAKIRRESQASAIEAAQVRLAAQASQLASTKLDVEEAERHWSRIQQLVASRDTSEATADEARFRYERAKTHCDAAVKEHQACKASLLSMQQSLKAADIDVERAELALAAATITSPMNGTIVRQYIRVGEIAGNPSSVLMEIAELDHLVLVARADEQAVAQLQAGQAVTLLLNGHGNHAFAGKIESIAPTAAEDRHGKPYFPVTISIDAGGKTIRPGIGGEARIDRDAR